MPALAPRVRQRLTELGVPFVAQQVPTEPADHEEMRRRTGTEEIPALLLEDGTAITGEADELIAWLDERYSERAAAAHRAKAAEFGVPGAG